MRHLLSQRSEGIDIQVYCTVIVCLLLCLITGHKPNQSNRNMIGWYLIGLASQQELIDHLNPAGQHRREAGGQRRALEKTRLLASGNPRPAATRR